MQKTSRLQTKTTLISPLVCCRFPLMQFVLLSLVSVIQIFFVLPNDIQIISVSTPTKLLWTASRMGWNIFHLLSTVHLTFMDCYDLEKLHWQGIWEEWCQRLKDCLGENLTLTMKIYQLNSIVLGHNSLKTTEIQTSSTGTWCAMLSSFTSLDSGGVNYLKQ